jgi:hypothetical protein
MFSGFHLGYRNVSEVGFWLCCGRICVTLLLMTWRQKRIVVALVAANALIIPILVVFATRFPNPPLSPLPTPAAERINTSLPQALDEAPAPTLEPAAREACQWWAAQMLAQAGLGGTVALIPDGLLRFEIIYSLGPGQTVEDAAQSAWMAFDIALVLLEQGRGQERLGRDATCADFTRIEIMILTLRPSPGADLGEFDHTVEASSTPDGADAAPIEAQINANVGVEDLVAFDAGELGQDEFIERVTYSVSPVDDE